METVCTVRFRVPYCVQRACGGARLLCGGRDGHSLLDREQLIELHQGLEVDRTDCLQHVRRDEPRHLHQPRPHRVGERRQKK